MMRNLLLIISFLLFNFSVFSQTDNVLPDSNLTVYDLLYLKQMIDNDEVILSELNKKVFYYQTKVQETKRAIEINEQKLAYYTDIYASLLKHIYLLKLQLQSNNIFIFSSKSFHQAFARYNYLFFILSYISEVKEYLTLVKLEQEKQILMYENYSNSLNFYLINYQNKKIEIDNKVKFALNTANILQQKANNIRIMINNNYSNYEKLTNYLENTELTQNENGNKKFYSTINPLREPVVISSFGVHNHPYLKNVSVENDGIDLYSAVDTIVKCIAYGEVVSIVKLPNFGNSVIIKHGDYYSVYSHLNMVYVEKNQKILASQMIGSLSAKTSKYSFACLNLQIWYNTEKLNPKKHLKL